MKTVSTEHISDIKVTEEYKESEINERIKSQKTMNSQWAQNSISSSAI